MSRAHQSEIGAGLLRRGFASCICVDVERNIPCLCVYVYQFFCISIFLLKEALQTRNTGLNRTIFSVEGHSTRHSFYAGLPIFGQSIGLVWSQLETDLLWFVCSLFERIMIIVSVFCGFCSRDDNDAQEHNNI